MVSGCVRANPSEYALVLESLIVFRISLAPYLVNLQSNHPIHKALMANKIKVPTLHVYGDKDEIRSHSVDLAAAFEGSISISHPQGGLTSLHLYDVVDMMG